MKQIHLPPLTLENVLKATERYDTPLNGNVIVVAQRAPIITSSGVLIGDAAQEKEQKKLDSRGFMVAKVPNTKNCEVEPGDMVVISGHPAIAFNVIHNTDEAYEELELREGAELENKHYKAYNIICVHMSSLATTLKK